jgi:SAM-dependent methyltransferase
MLMKILRKIRAMWHTDIIYQMSQMPQIPRQTFNEISYLCDLYGSDKGSLYGGGGYYSWPAHTYTPVYEHLFSPVRGSVDAVFECGLGTNNPSIPSSMGIDGQPGASLRVWRDYFPNAIVVGADIDKDILFEDERIHTGFIDQTSPQEIDNFFASLAPKYPASFDIMIDDGLHTFDAAVCLFENSFSHLKEGGLYVIEDMNLKNIPRFKNYFNGCKYADILSVNYMLMSQSPNQDNNLIMIRKIAKR